MLFSVVVIDTHLCTRPSVVSSQWSATNCCSSSDDSLHWWQCHNVLIMEWWQSVLEKCHKLLLVKWWHSTHGGSATLCWSWSDDVLCCLSATNCCSSSDDSQYWRQCHNVLIMEWWHPVLVKCHKLLIIACLQVTEAAVDVQRRSRSLQERTPPCSVADSRRRSPAWASSGASCSTRTKVGVVSATNNYLHPCLPKLRVLALWSVLDSLSKDSEFLIFMPDFWSSFDHSNLLQFPQL